MDRGYYGDFEEDIKVDLGSSNLIGYGLSEDFPVTLDSKEYYNTGKDRLVQCMVDILDTPKGSRFFNPEYGSELYRLVYEQNDFVAKDMAELYIKNAIERWEPRVLLLKINVESETTSKVMKIGISYKIRSSNEIGSFVYSFNRQYPELR